MLKEPQKKTWKQINFRTVDTMLAVEFLHDLYNRHNPYINSLRFRNTLLVVKGGEVTSYAPNDEWEFLAEWFGERFLRGDADVYEEIENLIKFDKPALKKLLGRFEKTDFSTLDDIALGLSLIDLQFVTLAEIYKVNVVQIEHALTYTINEQLKRFYPIEKDRQEAFATLIIATEPTIAVQEEIKFLNIVLNNRQEDIVEHHKNYAYIHSAYGTKPYTIEEYTRKYNDLQEKGKSYIQNRIKGLEGKFSKILKQKKKFIDNINDDALLIKNIDLFIRIGSLRDKNKALMGTTTKWNAIILDEVSKRKDIPKEQLNLYFLREICDLLKYGNRLDAEAINKRKTGFGLQRKEEISFTYDEAKKIIIGDIKEVKTLKGMCASNGTYSGIVKIIKSANDIYKMEAGNIMVSPGTDFDLVNAMQIAGAIVTEEGGILSHASVVSRELGIPCIIGVKQATDLLKDGDLVKVDAANGTIEISSN